MVDASPPCLLSAESGVPVGTIKFYLREQLLPPGERTSPNQARYTEAHVRRLKLVRALIETGGCSVAEVRRVVETAVVGTVLGDALFAALRRLGDQHQAAKRFGSAAVDQR